MKPSKKLRTDAGCPVVGERGAAGAERDIRGFALKFYAEEGNWDN